MTTVRDLTVGLGVVVDAGDLFALERIVQRLERAFIGLGIAGAAAFASIFGTSMKFEDSLASVMAYVDATGDEFERLKSRLATVSRDMAEQFGVSFDSIHDDMRNIINLGIQPTEEGFESLLTVLNKMKKIEPEADALKLVRTLYKAGKTWPDMPVEDIANKLFIAAKEAPNFMDEMAAAAEKGLTISRLLGQPIDQFLAMISLMSEMSVSGAQLGTRLFTGMGFLISGTGRAQKALAALGIDPQRSDLINKETGQFKSYSVMMKTLYERLQKYNDASKAVILTMLFGTRVANAYVSILSQEPEAFDKYLKKIGETGDQLEKGFITRMGSGTQKILIFREAIRNLFTTIQMNDAFGTAAHNLTIWVHNFRRFLEMRPDVAAAVSQITGLGLALITLTSLFGFLSMGTILIQAAMVRLGWTAATVWKALLLKPLMAAGGLILIALLLEDIITGAWGAKSMLDGLTESFGWSAAAAREFQIVATMVSLILLALASPVLLIAVGIVVVIVTIYEAISAMKEWGKVLSKTFPNAVDKVRDSLTKLDNFLKPFVERMNSYGGIFWVMLFGPLAIPMAQMMNAPGLLRKFFDWAFPETGTNKLMDYIKNSGGYTNNWDVGGGRRVMSLPKNKEGLYPVVMLEKTGEIHNWYMTSEESALRLKKNLEKDFLEEEMNAAASLYAEAFGDSVPESSQ